MSAEARLSDLSAEHTYRYHLLPLLTSLRSLHPRHLPILLLLACTYHSLHEYEASLEISQEILSIDDSYVEAMSNMGTTYKALGQEDKAQEWWRKALQARPTYWDAMDNILGKLFALAQDTVDVNVRIDAYTEALTICQFVQRHVVSDDGRLIMAVPATELHRLQRVYFTMASLYTMSDPSAFPHAIGCYCRAVEIAVRPPEPFPQEEAYTMLDILLAICVAGYILSAPTNGPVPEAIMQSLSLDGRPPFVQLAAQPPFDLLRLVHEASDRLLYALLQLGGGVLPTMLLLPEHILRLPMVIFPFSLGVLPAICTRNPQRDTLDLPLESIRQQTCLMTSTILLALAKGLQDETLSNTPLPAIGPSINASVSLIILLYYFALAVSPSPSTYNNLGIILCSLSSTRTVRTVHNEEQLLNGPMLARLYYQAGLQLDPGHPHLLTNLGSLMKDQGRVEEAIELYYKAIQRKPDFDIALANLGNTLKDMGRSWDAIEYYRRAVSLNPNLPEAMCGLVNSLCAICDWRGRGAVPHEIGVDDQGGIVAPSAAGQPGWITKMIEISEEQIDAAYLQNAGIVEKSATMDEWLRVVETVAGRPLRADERARWTACLGRYYNKEGRPRDRVNEVGFIIRFIDWVQPRLQRRWYIRVYGKILAADRPALDCSPGLSEHFLRPALPANLNGPPVPSVLPFHTFTYPLSPRTMRLIAHRNALRISYMAHSQTWLPKHVFHPPPPPVRGKLNIGYLSNDVNDHPLSHLMQSVFGFHDRNYFNVYVYTTSPWDGTDYRPRIANRVENFVDVSSWSAQAIVEHILGQEIHILVNLGGYTKGARNDIFAARPCPVQIQLMGYAGTLSAGWCDYLVGCEISSPPEMSGTELWRKSRGTAREQEHATFDFDADADPESPSEGWIHTEKLINIPHSFMVTDHKQSFRNDENLSVEERARVPWQQLWREEEKRRMQSRAQIFPDLPQDIVIFANFSQLYKVDPEIFATWLNILEQVPRSILWLLRFPSAGEDNLVRTARAWAGDGIASRIRFTGVATKSEHIHRSRVADLFLDTVECNAHTIAADVLWSGTPILTWPKHAHKMCSRVAASMASATGFGKDMVVYSLEEYVNRAVTLAQGLRYISARDPSGEVYMQGQGPLMKLRRNIFLNRDKMPLFDTMRWTRNLEKGYHEAWRRWVEGTQYEMTDEWEACQGPEKESGCIWIADDEPVNLIEYG